MLLLCLRKDQDVVQVYYYDPFSYDGSEDVVHHGLESSRTIGHSEKHYEQFEQATVGTESYLPFISGLDAYIIEAPTDIEFCEVLGSAELRDEFGDERERISVFDGHPCGGGNLGLHGSHLCIGNILAEVRTLFSWWCPHPWGLP